MLVGGLLRDPHDDLWSNSTSHCDGEGTELWQFKNLSSDLRGQDRASVAPFQAYTWLHVACQRLQAKMKLKKTSASQSHASDEQGQSFYRVL